MSSIVTLAEAKNNCTNDYDPHVIDEFRKESAIFEELPFDKAVNPAGGGATLTYGYRRLKTQPIASTREINTEYDDHNVETSQHFVNLAVMGGSFKVDRVLADIGPDKSGVVSLNMRQKIKAAVTKFIDEVINGDIAVDAHGFDGLDKALVGSSTEFGTNLGADWTDIDTTANQHKALDQLDEFLGFLDSTPSVVIGNKQSLARVRALVRRSNLYVKSPIEGLVGQHGRPIFREEYGGITFIDAGEKAGSSNLIVPTSAQGKSDLYAVRFGIDGFHGVTTTSTQIVRTWLPQFDSAGAVKRGEVELGPVSIALKATKAAAVFRGIKVR